MNNYLPIKILNQDFSKNIFILHQLFSSFPKEDIYFELNNNLLTIYLRELDFFHFKNSIQKLIKNSDSETAKLLNSIFYNVDKIKSYGLKGRKRLYVGYDKERKVKNREANIENGLVVVDNGDKNYLLSEVLNKVIIGDCLKVMKKLPAESFDCVFVDPPYFLQLPPKKLLRMLDLGFWILNDVIWFKTNPMPNFLGVRFTN